MEITGDGDGLCGSGDLKFDMSRGEKARSGLCDVRRMSGSGLSQSMGLLLAERKPKVRAND